MSAAAADGPPGPLLSCGCLIDLPFDVDGYAVSAHLLARPGWIRNYLAGIGYVK
jgi:hypothetical protein